MRLVVIDYEVLELLVDHLTIGIFEEVRKDDVFAVYERVCAKRLKEPRDRRIFFKQLRTRLGPGYRQERRRFGSRREYWLVGIGLKKNKTI